MVNYLNTGISGDLLDDGAGNLLTDELTGLASVTLILTSVSNPSVQGTNITLTLHVTPPDATGHVSFARDAGVILGDGLLDGVTGIFVVVTSNTGGIGHHDISANYDGDTTYAPGSSNLIDQLVIAPNRRYVVFNM